MYKSFIIIIFAPLIKVYFFSKFLHTMTTFGRIFIFGISFYLVYCLINAWNSRRTTKYKVGDVVKVKNRHWYNKNRNSQGTVFLSNGYEFDGEYGRYCGRKLTIAEVKHNFYFVEENEYVWTDDMFE